MKQCLLSFSLALLSFTSAVSQVVDTSLTKPADNFSNPRTGDDVFNCIVIGVIIPQGTFAQPVGDPHITGTDFDNLTLPFKGQGGLGGKPGFNFQYVGFRGFGQPHKSYPTCHFGLQYGFDFGYLPLDWSNINWNKDSLNMTVSPFLYGGLKIGPAFYVNPVHDLGIGIYAQADLSLTVPGGIQAGYSYTDTNKNNTTIQYTVQDGKAVHGNINFSGGLNIYYKPVIIGVEYSLVHTKYSANVKDYATQTNGATAVETDYSFVSLLRANLIKVTLGVRLGYGNKYRQ